MDAPIRFESRHAASDGTLPSPGPARAIPVARSLTALSLLVVSVVGPPPPSAAAQQHDAGHAHHAGDLGAVDFQVSCAPEVRADFDRALALLHHMMYPESRAAFTEIAERDPDCAMAHWGYAMTQVQPLWYRGSPEALRRGWEAVQRARALGPGSERESALVTATAELFRDPDEPDWWARLQRWSDAMAGAHRSYPEDTEIGALFGLSQLAAAQTAEDRVARNARAAELLARIHEREPTHPGAIHYTIHANDVDGRAGESLDVVQSYSGIAPSVPHALHMPTHIFVRLGEWPDVIEWNRRSADAALEYPAGDAVSLHYVHAIDYMVYAHLQRGEDEAARALLEEVRAKGKYEENFAAAFHLAAIPARLAVERRDWAAAAALEPRTPASLAWDRYAWAEALTRFARGLGAARSGDPAAAQEAEAKLEALRARAEESGQSDWATYIEIDRRVLAGWIAHAEGEAEQAVQLVRSAGELEGTVQKHPVTPGALLPPYEALGDLLLEIERPAEALKAYETSNEIWPGRYNTLLGAARAARAAGDGAKARTYYEELLAVAGAASDRPGLKEAREYLQASPTRSSRE